VLNLVDAAWETGDQEFLLGSINGKPTPQLGEIEIRILVVKFPFFLMNLVSWVRSIYLTW
jgi:hypothetical protein